ncbi:MAG: PAS domain S-box protein, partial [Synechococcaceae cyanobacterium RL_1_2]|nr:PAS domain S-box protein [Synechococcaceae cyanobacterium RL_1_2]
MPTFTWSQHTADSTKLVLIDYNQAAYKFCGASIPSYLGRQPEDLFIDGSEVAHALHLCLQEQTVVEIKDDNGQHRFTAIAHGSEEALLYYSSPVNICKIQDQLELRLRQQSNVVLISQRALAPISVEQICSEITMIVGQTLELPYCYLLELIAEGEYLQMKGGYGFPPQIINKIKVYNDPKTLMGYSLTTNGLAIIADIEHQQFPQLKLDQFLHNLDIASGIAFPINLGDQRYGLLGVYGQHKRHFDDHDINFVETVAFVIASAIERSQQRDRLHLLSRAINASNHGVVISNAEPEKNSIIFANDSFVQMSGYGWEEIKGKPTDFLAFHDQDEALYQSLKKSLAEGKETHLTMRNYRQDGTIFWNELSLSPIHNDAGLLTHFITVQTDITDRKCIEENLQLTQFCLDQATDGVFWLHSSGYFLYVNDAGCRILGYEREELLAKKAEDIGSYWLESGSQMLGQDSQVQVVLFETELRHQDGTLVYVEISSSYLHFNDQYYTCAFVRDISSRKEAELALQESEEKFRGIFEQAAVGIILVTMEGIVQGVNPGACKILEYSREEFLDLHFEEIMQVVKYDELLKDLFATGKDRLTQEQMYTRQMGAKVWLQVTMSVVRDQENSPKNIVVIFTDISDRKRTEDAYHETQERFNSILNSLDDIV